MPWTGILTACVPYASPAQHKFYGYVSQPQNPSRSCGMILTGHMAYRFGRYLCPSSCSIHPLCPTLRSGDQIPHSELPVILSASYCGRSDWPSKPCLTRKRHVVTFLFRVNKTYHVLFQLYYKLNNPPKHKPFTVREPDFSLPLPSLTLAHTDHS